MYAVRLETKGHTAHGSTYTLEAIATLLGFGASHVAKMVVLALNVGVLLMMEGYPLVRSANSRVKQGKQQRTATAQLRHRNRHFCLLV